MAQLQQQAITNATGSSSWRELLQLQQLQRHAEPNKPAAAFTGAVLSRIAFALDCWS
jgi:hypothetical protein